MLAAVDRDAWFRGRSGIAPVQGGFAGQASAYEVDHRDVDYGFGAVGVGFVVAGEAAVVHQPAEGPLDNPTSEDHLEPFDAWVALDDFDVDAEAGAVVDGFCSVAGVGPRLGHSRGSDGNPGQQVDAAGVVGDARRVTQTASSCPGVSTPIWRLRPAIFLPASMPWPAAGTLAEVLMLCASSPQALGSASRPSACRTRRRSRPLNWSKHLPYARRRSSRRPSPMVRSRAGQVTPGDPGAVDVEDGVHDAPQVVLG
jgi:hypothetical protein